MYQFTWGEDKHKNRTVTIKWERSFHNKQTLVWREREEIKRDRKRNKTTEIQAHSHFSQVKQFIREALVRLSMKTLSDEESQFVRVLTDAGHTDRTRPTEEIQ